MDEAPIDEATRSFRSGLELAAENLAADALQAFRRVVETWPAHDLADDALFNVGACYLAMNQPLRAAEAFRRILADYPTATISSVGSFGHETGRTAAKAHLGLISAALALGDVEAAKESCRQLENYPEAKVVASRGVERTFAEIGRSLLNATTAPHGDVDHVTPADVVG